MANPVSIASIGLLKLAKVVAIASIGLLSPSDEPSGGTLKVEKERAAIVEKAIKRKQELARQNQEALAQLVVGETKQPVDVSESELIARISSASETQGDLALTDETQLAVSLDALDKLVTNVTGLVGNVQNQPVSIQVIDDLQSKAAFSDDYLIALIMILAEID